MFSKIAVILPCLLSATTASPFAAFPAITLGVGSTTGVLTAAQTTVAVAALAGLAIAKEALILAARADANRKRRDVEEQLIVDFTDMFEGIEAKDPAGCAKLLVCEAFSKPEFELNGEERAVRGLFEDLDTIQANAYGKFQLAAKVGAEKGETACRQIYSKCPISIPALANLLNVQ